MNIMSLINALPGASAQGLIWGIMAIGVYLTFRILDVADLTVDGTMCTGGAVCVMMLMSGHNIWVSMLAATGAGMLAGLATGIFHTFMGIPAILAGILTQLGLYSANLKIMGKANQAVNGNKYNLLVSLRNVKNVPFYQNTILIVAIFIVVLIAILYWFFGTELGCSLRATGCNPNMSRAQGINTDVCKVLGLMIWFYPLLSGTPDCYLARNRYRPSEDAVCTCSSDLPCCTLLESKIFFKTYETWR